VKKTIYANYHYTEPKLVLDTHVFTWFAFEDKKLSQKYIDIITEYRDMHALYLPAICLWEIALLVKNKRLKLNKPCGQWLHECTSKPGLTIAPLSVDIAIESVDMSPNFHSDPADRLIVATARVLNAKLMTRDTKILQYAENGFVECIEI
jgi:PIN domain nuclease of toxin-antitoxin system